VLQFVRGNILIAMESLDRAVGITPGYGLNGRGIVVRFLAEVTSFSLVHSFQNGPESTHSPNQWTQGQSPTLLAKGRKGNFRQGARA
jgi:hypothetical protein